MSSGFVGPRPMKRPLSSERSAHVAFHRPHRSMTDIEPTASESVAAPTEAGGPSVRDLFGDEAVGEIKKRLASLLTDDEFARWREGLAGALAAVPWPAAVESVAEMVGAFLDTPFAPPLRRVYAESKVLERYLDRDAYDPEETVHVELAEHTVETSRSPRIDVTVNGAPVGSLTFDIKIRLDLKGLVLTVQDARVKKVAPGSCEATGTVSFYGKTLATKEAEPIKLPPLDLGEGILIAPWSDKAAVPSS